MHGNKTARDLLTGGLVLRTYPRALVEYLQKENETTLKQNDMTPRRKGKKEEHFPL